MAASYSAKDAFMCWTPRWSRARCSSSGTTSGKATETVSGSATSPRSQNLMRGGATAGRPGITAQPRTLARVDLRLAQAATQRLRRDAELPRELGQRQPARARQPRGLGTKLGRIRRSCLRHLDSFLRPLAASIEVSTETGQPQLALKVERVRPTVFPKRAAGSPFSGRGTRVGLTAGDSARR